MSVVKISDFAKRHFDKNFVGTKILDMSPENFEKRINHILGNVSIYSLDEERYNFVSDIDKIGQMYKYNIVEGYAPFCKLLFVENFTEAKVGSLPITLENYQYLRSGYSARREEELPTFSRWLELPTGIPKAEWLCIVCYDQVQMTKESMPKETKMYDEYVDKRKNETLPSETFFSWLKSNSISYTTYKDLYGVVAILGQSHPGEEPMKPETMLRNALGVEEGGSGHKLNKEDYLKSVDFWDKNATVR